MGTASRSLAIVTGASTGIGYELARICAQRGYDLAIAANEPRIHDAAVALRAIGARVDAVEADLSTTEGCDRLIEVVGDRPVAALLANAGHGLGKAFLDQDFEDIRHVVDTNVTGTLYLVHRIGRLMRALGQGRILITGSIAGFMPGAYHAVYNGTKAMIDSFSYALREELKGSGVSVTCLMPGVTATEFFARAGLLDTKVGAGDKMRADEVARIGFDAMLKGEPDVVAGLKNKIQATVANVVPAEILAKQHAAHARPGSASSS
jgi:short-subunit dehydrogenase